MRERRSNVPIKSVDRSIQLLQALSRRERASLSDLVTDINAAKSTVHNHLLTLERQGLVTRDSDGAFRIGPEMLKFGTDFKRQYDFVMTMSPTVHDIARQTGEICTFLIEVDREGVIVLAAEGEDSPSTSIREGVSGPLHAIPGGKALLAYHSELRDTLLRNEVMSDETAHTISDPEQLDDELDRIVAQGYSMNDEEYQSGLRAISVPMLPKDDRVVGALSVVGPTSRLQDPEYTRQILDLLFAAQTAPSVYRSTPATDTEPGSDERLSFWTQYGSS